MDLQLVKKSVLDYTQKKKRWVAMVVALGFSSYAAYRVYRFPLTVQKRERISKLVSVLVSVAEVVSDSAETIGLVSEDLKEFLQSESDQIPNSFKQIAKVAISSEFSESVISLTQALTSGILRGFRSKTDSDANLIANPGFLDKVFDKLSTPAGSGLVSSIVGTFAKNLVLGLYQDGNSVGELNSVTKWVHIVSGQKCKELIADCIQLFVSTAVAVYLDKTMHINTYDEIIAGLTNPKHEKQVTDVIVSVCNGAIQTLVKTSHEVLTNPESEPTSMVIDRGEYVSEKKPSVEGESFYSEPKRRKRRRKSFEGGSIGKRLVLEMTGRITFETVRSLLESLVEKVYEGVKRFGEIVHEVVVERGIGAVRYVATKSSVTLTACLSLFLQIIDGASWIMLPA